MSDADSSFVPDQLMGVAERLDLLTDESAGPPGSTGLQVWARWPRDRLTVAHEVLARVREIDADATLELAGPRGTWRARLRDWAFTGEFEEAVVVLASRVCERRRRGLVSRRHRD